MAELNTGGGGGKGDKKVRSKKMSTRVDLTAMVDLAFLLITFFMLTTTLAKPKAMDLNMPDKNKDKPEDVMKVDDRRTLNVILGTDNKVEWYMGRPDAIQGQPQVVGYTANGIQKVMADQSKKVVAITGDPAKGVVVLIKPTDKANYRNLVDILDMIAVLNIQQYAIVETTNLDIQLAQRDKVYPVE